MTCHVMSCKWWRCEPTNLHLPLTTNYITSYNKSCEIFDVFSITKNTTKCLDNVKFKIFKTKF